MGLGHYTVTPGATSMKYYTVTPEAMKYYTVNPEAMAYYTVVPGALAYYYYTITPTKFI